MGDPQCPHEKKLAESLKNGDFNAFDQLFKHYNRRLYYFALSILKNKEDACDVVQEVFLRVWKKKENIDQAHSFKSFLFTISYNLIVDIMRKKVSDKNFRDHLFKNTIKTESSTDKTLKYRELNQIYYDSIEELPPQRKKIYKLQRFQHLNYEEIAQIMGISVNTVRSQMSKAIAYIRNKVGRDTLLGLLFITLYV